MQNISERILLTLWVGGMWIVGFVVTPTLFYMIDDRSLAGSVAGRLFTILAYLGLVCGVLLLVSILTDSRVSAPRNWRVWALVGMLIVIVVGVFVLTPEMSVIRDAGMQVADKERFDFLHQLASILFTINSLAGLTLVVFGVRDAQVAVTPAD